MRSLAAAALLLGASSCLPADTRPPAASILLDLTSADEPSVMTADGWSISVDRLLIGIGDARLRDGCDSYSDARYGRLLDGRLATDQKVSILFGLGHCLFDFGVRGPSPDSLLGVGVTEADKEAMGSRDDPGSGPRTYGTAVDFAATATRGAETKHLRWMLQQGTTFTCGRLVDGGSPQPLALQSDENDTLHIGVRGVALFSDDADPATAVLRFDPMAAADTTFGDDDGDITLDELGQVSLDEVRHTTSGPYTVGRDVAATPSTLEDYVYLVLFSHLVKFREDIDCGAKIGAPLD